MMSQSVVVQFDSCVVHTTLSHFTNCINRLELKSSRKLLLQSTRFAAQRIKFTLIGFGFHQVIIDTSSFIFSFNFPTHKENFQNIFYLSLTLSIYEEVSLDGFYFQYHLFPLWENI